MSTPTTNRAFRRSVAEKKKGVVEQPTVAFTLDWVDDEDPEKVIRSDTFHATRPTDERLFLIAALAGDEDAGGVAEAAAVVEIFRDALPEDEYRILRRRIKDPEDDVNLDMLQDVMFWLMGEWSSFPTAPASDSSASRRSTGAKSTGRVRGPGSTRSTTDSPAS
jgi:hypothetical protein